MLRRHFTFYPTIPVPRSSHRPDPESADYRRVPRSTATVGRQTGDAVLLMGRFHTHRRDKLPKGAKSMSIFLHWVNIEYQGELKAGGHALSGYATSELLIPQVGPGA